uniref:CLIP-associated protein n=1 Tax=Rhizophora mucronata TaxID=61149 RepID=A0A2P2J6T9_RHIMU
MRHGSQHIIIDIPDNLDVIYYSLYMYFQQAMWYPVCVRISSETIGPLHLILEMFYFFLILRRFKSFVSQHHDLDNFNIFLTNFPTIICEFCNKWGYYDAQNIARDADAAIWT